MRRAWLLAALIACSGDRDKPPGPCETGRCVADPAPHCIGDSACTTTSECPSGLICSEPFESSAGCGTASGSQCRWTPRAVAASALRPLATDAMNVIFASGPPAQLTWDAPDGAAVVACAVFRCEPRVDVRSGPSATDDDASLEQIVNFDECALGLFVNTASRTAVPLRKDELYAHTPGAGTCTGSQPGPAILESITGACWAYDDHQLIAASELVDVDPTTLGELQLGLPTDESCAHDGDDCYAHADNYFGTCTGGHCQPRCTSDMDCEHADFVLHGVTPGASCGWTCDIATGAIAGVCRPR